MRTDPVTNPQEPEAETAPQTADPDAVPQPSETGGSHEKAKENLSVVRTFLSTFVVACIVIAALMLIAVKVSGCYLFTIETGSMTPAYPVGTVVVVKPYDAFSEVAVGDVVTYLIDAEGDTVTHRVVAIDSEERTLTTRGDANEDADLLPVLYENVVGKVVIAIPKLGALVKAVQNPDNRPVVIVVIAVLLFWSFLWDPIRNGIRRHRAKRKQE